MDHGLIPLFLKPVFQALGIEVSLLRCTLTASNSPREHFLQLSKTDSLSLECIFISLCLTFQLKNEILIYSFPNEPRGCVRLLASTMSGN